MKKNILSGLAALLLLLAAGPLSAQALISSELLGNRSLAQMQAQFGLLAQNGIEMHRILYSTQGLDGQPDTASGLLVLPVREQVHIYPLLCYQHGTVDSRTDVPSNLQGGWLLAAAWGALGYVTAAPDFIGLGTSRGFHPYVHADTEASAAVDMLLAVRQYAEGSGLLLNEQLFITGYSQGGHAAAAAHRAIQQDFSADFTVTASAPMSGPYSISGVMKDLILSEDEYFFPSYVPNTVLSFNLAYNIGYPVEAYFKQPYADLISAFYAGEVGLFTLNDQLIAALTDNTGASVSRRMLQDSVVSIVETQPQHPLSLALADNDLYDWAPQAPTRLYYCMADDQVPFRNSVIADSVMNLNGAPNLLALDVNPGADHGACVQPAVINAALFFAQYRMLTVVVSTEAGSSPQAPISVYPNPARDVVNIGNLPSEPLVQVFDQSGRLAIQRRLGVGANQLAINGLSPGVYTMRLTWDGGTETQQLIVRD